MRLGGRRQTRRGNPWPDAPLQNLPGLDYIPPVFVIGGVQDFDADVTEYLIHYVQSDAHVIAKAEVQDAVDQIHEPYGRNGVDMVV